MKKLNYDDVLIVPQYSTIESRKHIDLTTNITKRRELTLPFVSSPMDTVTEYGMAHTLEQLGCLGVVHRYCSIEYQREIISKLEFSPFSEDKVRNIAAAIGVKDEWLERSQTLVDAGCTILVIDVAHADHKMVHDALRHLKTDSGFKDVDILVGAIATGNAAKKLCDLGADGIRIGVGPGSHCTTRIETGVGYPQLSAIIEVKEVAHSYQVPVCADGGIRFAGDITKALAAGADTIMAGGLFAATKESPGDLLMMGYGNSRKSVKEYRGQASYNSKVQDQRVGEHIEGISQFIPYRGPVEDIVKQLAEGVKSGLSYVGAHDLKEFRQLVQFVEVSATDNHLPKMGM